MKSRRSQWKTRPEAASDVVERDESRCGWPSRQFGFDPLLQGDWTHRCEKRRFESKPAICSRILNLCGFPVTGVCISSTIRKCAGILKLSSSPSRVIMSFRRPTMRRHPSRLLPATGRPKLRSSAIFSFICARRVHQQPDCAISGAASLPPEVRIRMRRQGPQPSHAVVFRLISLTIADVQVAWILQSNARFRCRNTLRNVGMRWVMQERR